MTSALATHRDVATTLAVSPVAVAGAGQAHDHAQLRVQDELDALTGDEVLGSPYVPINVAALTEAGLTGEIGAQVTRGDDLLRGAGLKPAGGPWVDATSSFTQGDAADLASGLQVAGSAELVLSDGDLASAGVSNLTFAQPFNLDLGHGSTIPAAAVDSSLSAHFTQYPGDPVLAAEQLLAWLSFVHFENAFVTEHRGVVIVPPANWQPSASFMDTLLGGLQNNPSLSAVTLSEFFEQVPVGGNGEPSVRRLQSGPAGQGITHNAADKIANGAPAARLVQPARSVGTRPRWRRSATPSCDRSARALGERALRRARRVQQVLRRARRTRSPSPLSAPSPSPRNAPPSPSRCCRPRPTR